MFTGSRYGDIDWGAGGCVTPPTPPPVALVISSQSPLLVSLALHFTEKFANFKGNHITCALLDGFFRAILCLGDCLSFPYS